MFNISIDSSFEKITFHLFNLFRFYWKYFNIILSFYLYSLGENKTVYSNKLLTFNKKSINPIQYYQNITLDCMLVFYKYLL